MGRDVRGPLGPDWDGAASWAGLDVKTENARWAPPGNSPRRGPGSGGMNTAPARRRPGRAQASLRAPKRRQVVRVAVNSPSPSG
eukprot:3276963-Pyramimonas_sp.AAC.1